MDPSRQEAAPARDGVGAPGRIGTRCLACIGLLSLTSAAIGAGTPIPWRTAVAHQAALDRAGFSPGVIDGQIGRKTTLALRTFQTAHGLSATGEFDKCTRAALEAGGAPATITYTVTAADLRAVGPVPRDWNAKARLDRLRYESLAALLAERGHCTRALVARLNPRRDLNRLRPGDRIVLPNVKPRALPRAASVDVDLDAKIVRAKDKAGRTVALFHCSIAKSADQRPRGNARVTAVAFDPVYTFDPRMWPEVRGVTKKLRIPPGPRNPVGVCWIDLSLPGYGIHGTPSPELIGKTGSHGCIRLANWDARRLGQMVRAGTPVRFVGR
jgi:lipoprotein-anchoring transpeptidase ErfK/SrfK